MNFAFRPSARGLLPALPLLLLTSVASAQGDTALEYDSAVDSHRRLDGDGAPLPPGADSNDTIERDDPRVEPETVAEGAGAENGAKPAGDLPMPVDPAGAMPAEDGEPDIGSAMPKAMLGHESVLEDYVPYDEVDGPTWVEANRRVGEIGGWREYAKELYAPPADAADGGEDR